MRSSRHYAFKNAAGTPTAVTATKTSDPIDMEGALKATFQFIRANHTSGSTVFSVEVSNDGVNWVTYNKLVDNVANTNVQNKTRVASASLASNTSKMYSMDLEDDMYKFARLTATITTDGDGQINYMLNRNS